MNETKDRDIRIACCDASAVLYDLLSAAFAYPGRNVLDDLSGGMLQRQIEVLDCEPLRVAARELGAALETFAGPGRHEQLESDYIALFELNPQRPPLHLNAHLYADGTPDPVPVYQRLIATYLAFGMELRDGEGVERPDHLGVQLEFMAYLHQLLGRALRGEPDRTVDFLEAGIEAFRSELSWVPRWLALLGQRGGHPLYTPLGNVLEALLQHPARVP